MSYSLTVPIFEAPDEPAHFLYANDLAAGDGLPVLDYSESPKEYHQPPLYYWLVAGVMRWFDTDGYKQFTVRNPHAAISDASTLGNKNAYLHDPKREGWPFKGLSLAVHMGRLVSVGLGMVTVWATYSLALKLFSPDLTGFACLGRQARGNLPVLGLAAAAAMVVAFNPQFLFISGALNNDNAVTALSSLALWATVTYYSHGDAELERPRSVRWLVALGGLSGLAILSKTTGLAVVALILGVLATKAVRQRLIRTLWLDAGIVILLAALIGGWWYVRNALLYADPLLSRYIHRWLSDEVAAPRTAIEILRRFEQGEISFWGTFGWLNITWDEWVYKLLRTWTRLSGLGLLVLGISNLRWLIHRSPHPIRGTSLVIGKRKRVAISPLVITLAWTGLVAAMLVQWILVSGGLQGRLLFPAISALAVLLIAGWTSLVPYRWRPVAAVIPVLGLALLAIATPFVTISPAYARPTTLSSTDLPSDVTLVDLTYADRVKLIGYHVSPSPTRRLPLPTHRSPLGEGEPQAAAHPGDRVDVTLYWQVLDAIPNDFSVFVHLFGRDRQRIGTIDTYPGLGNFPTSQWEAGEVIRDVYPIRIAPDAASPTLVTISVGWYDFHSSREGIHALDSLGNPTTAAGVFKLIPQIWPESKPIYELNTNFGDIITLSGYDIQLVGQHNNSHRDANLLYITLYWHCDAPPTADFTVFMHLVDTNGNIIAQMDQPPLNGDYPTSVWESGEVIQDKLTVPLPSAEPSQPHRDADLEAQPNKLWLRVGLYRSDDGMRLPVLDASGQVIGDAITSSDWVTLP